MKKLSMLVLATALTGSAAVYAADMTMKEAISKAEAAGYTDIHEVEKKYNHYEMEARNSSGERVELKMDMSGKIYRVEKED